MRTTIVIHERDSLTVAVTVTIRDTALLPQDLTGATVQVLAQRRTGGPSVAATAVVSDGPAGQITANFVPGTFGAGIWHLQTVVALDGDVWTSAGVDLSVQPSIPDA